MSEIEQKCKFALQALNDWASTYAPDMCDPEKVAEAKARILQHGTLWYIATATEQLHAVIRALSAQAQDVDRWQPIETAPRDGTTVLLYAPGWDSPQTGWTYGKDDWQDCPYSSRGDETYQPTHWMPTPAAPARKEGGK